MIDRFVAFAERKVAAALAADFEPFATVEEHSAGRSLEPLGNAFSETILDGPFWQSPLRHPRRPVVSLVFVQSRDGNTEAPNPASLGGGDTDTHVIYEGLSRVAADAVMAGAQTVRDGGTLFSVWHPELVRVRESLGKPRHPVQIVASLAGALPIETGLLFNVPDVPVVIVSSGQAAANLDERTRSRPWITVINSGAESDLPSTVERLRTDLGIERISAVGGRTLAAALVDAGLVTDLYLTTSPVEGGRPGTPMYAGTQPPARELVVRKRSRAGVLFEHFILTSR